MCTYARVNREIILTDSIGHRTTYLVTSLTPYLNYLHLHLFLCDNVTRDTVQDCIGRSQVSNLYFSVYYVHDTVALF